MQKPVDREKREADLKVRLKLFTTNATTYGYAMMGASFIDPYIKGVGFKVSCFVGMGLALVLHTLSWYVAPYGEKP
jgi:Na+-translocating ferredoxin:NAD+ oxidoreductase RnfA subunit